MKRRNNYIGPRLIGCKFFNVTLLMVGCITVVPPPGNSDLYPIVVFKEAHYFYWTIDR